MLVGIEVGEAHIVGEPVRKISSRGFALRSVGAFKARSFEVLTSYSAVTAGGQGVCRGPELHIYGFPPTAQLARQAAAEAALGPHIQPKRN
jgi:hypothetical protein